MSDEFNKAYEEYMQLLTRCWILTPEEEKRKKELESLLFGKNST